ncbi:MAG: MFS transporter [Bryobacterales bacterium]|nr:MFS transporter [Bryobacterales bacterium]
MQAERVKLPGTQPADAPYPRPAYAWYVLLLLTVVYIFSFIDRQILNLLVGPVRRDLGLTDTQMSLLMGFSFALFYTGFGIPLGRLADQHSRRTIIAIGFATWSLFSAGCGLTRTFVQMLLMRVGVGVGEATLSPAAYSLLTDYFPPQRRATALSVYGMGIYIGSGLAFLLGGFVTGWSSKQEDWVLPLVGAVRSWQLVFIAVGLPGVALALLMYTVKEPVRRGAAGVAAIPIGEVLRYMRANWKTYFCHNVGIALLSFSSYGSAAWIPSFFVRTHGWTAADMGKIYGVLVAVFGALGIVWGGWLADRWAERGRKDATMRVALMVSIAWLPTGVAYLLVPNAWLAMALLAPTVFLVAAPFGIAPAAIMQVTPARMRGQASSIYLFVINLIGLGIGPTAVAMVTDYVFADDNRVGSSILLVTVVAHVISAVLLWLGLKPYVRSQEMAREWLSARSEG